MKKNAEHLYLFTNEYPYGTGESFIERELAQHLKHFKSITIFPLNKKTIVRTLDSRIVIVDLFDEQSYHPSELLRKNFFLFFNILIGECAAIGLNSKLRRQFAVLKSRLLQNFYRARLLQQYLDKTSQLNSTVLYSFWTDDWATTLSILKEEKRIGTFVSRVHGYDLFAERWPDGILPFRRFQLDNVSKIFAVSKAGLAYLKQHYPKYENKFYLNHLSIFDNGTGPFDDKAVFTIVSCANLIPLKRVHLIAEALCTVSFDVSWFHFGDGTEKERLPGIIKKMPATVKVELKGAVSNDVLIDFYKKNTVHAFIHMSETEGGVPLALQEAASFGIPLIGAIAGGAAEIINERTGIPLPVDVNAAQLCEALNKFKNGSKNTVAFRKEVRQFWEQTFSSDSNYLQLYDQMTQ
jgi:glycosyltransferase involved in cell wall biosynthesis